MLTPGMLKELKSISIGDILPNLRPKRDFNLAFIEELRLLRGTSVTRLADIVIRSSGVTVIIVSIRKLLKIGSELKCSSVQRETWQFYLY